MLFEYEYLRKPNSISVVTFLIYWGFAKYISDLASSILALNFHMFVDKYILLKLIMIFLTTSGHLKTVKISCIWYPEQHPHYFSISFTKIGIIFWQLLDNL